MTKKEKEIFDACYDRAMSEYVAATLIDTERFAPDGLVGAVSILLELKKSLFSDNTEQGA